MDERIAFILKGIGDAEMALVATGALGIDRVGSAGKMAYEEIVTPHGEARTVAIVRVSGMAAGRAWSSVAKVLDLAIAGQEWVAGVTEPANEEIVYEERYFADDGLRFRPAACYHVSRPSDGIKVLWLEDLTDARGSPFSIEQIAEMSRHLGEWNAVQASREPSVKFAIGKDAYAKRYERWRFDRRLDELKQLEQHPTTRAAYGSRPIGLASELHIALSANIEAAGGLPHGLAFGDCSAGNVFYRPGETIAIDWASLTNDPVGVDGGCLIGSTITWGRDFAEVAGRERELFGCYLDGLASGGWRGRLDDLRRAYLGQFGFYLGTITTLPVMLGGTVLPIEHIEKRFQLPIAEIAPRSAAIIDLIPGYIDELRTLLG